ncbi:MAG TPA: aldolase/citrate lyase family protein [Solirubrobacteraceae bacterium]
MASSVRRRLAAGERLLGTVLACRDPGLAELAGAHFDLAWIDLEHSALDIADVPPLALALTAARCDPLVRLPSSQFERFAAVLDVGIDGVVVPRLETAAEAADVVARMHYPPAGTRGFAARRGAGYDGQVRDDDGPACLVQIESRAAVTAAPEIAEIHGVDALVVGSADLALDLGVPAELTGVAMRAALAAVRDAAHGAGAAFGLAVSGEPEVIAGAAGGCADLIVYSADVRIYAKALDEAGARLRTALLEPATESRQMPRSALRTDVHGR